MRERRELVSVGRRGHGRACRWGTRQLVTTVPTKSSRRIHRLCMESTTLNARTTLQPQTALFGVPVAKCRTTLCTHSLDYNRFWLSLRPTHAINLSSSNNPRSSGALQGCVARGQDAQVCQIHYPCKHCVLKNPNHSEFSSGAQKGYQ